MRKLLIIGGSNGLGLAIAQKSVSSGMFAVIADRCEPDSCAEMLNEKNSSYIYSDLLDFNEETFRELSRDEEICGVVITAGIGWVTAFENLHISEIRNIFQINTVSTIEIIRIFYERISGSQEFYCGVIGSIAGLVSSPLFSVYAASKAAICRFTESLNIELEEKGVQNRILNVSPASLKGTRFNGNANSLGELSDVADSIYAELMAHNTLFMPDYEKTLKGVISRYQNDAHTFGLSSFDYKMQSGRIIQQPRVRIGYLSGTFDLFHVGHLNLLKRAKQQCDYLIVGVHPDASHKGKQVFIPFEERMKIVGAVKYVDKVVPSCREDSDAWDLWHYTKLFVGSDYKGTERFRKYEEYFSDKNVEIVYFPYTQGTSSTQIRQNIINSNAPASKENK
ncbi:MAG TPA: glycerol-3-phosphate cytidylyltransferase [Ruminococcus sp.]|nr:glycerol-3-phosphate cytidylyltransferase [Ruminococcus sp.]